MSHPSATAASTWMSGDPYGTASVVEARRTLASRIAELADHPWIAGAAGFVTTAIVLLPVEYQVPINSLIMFLWTRRP